MTRLYMAYGTSFTLSKDKKRFAARIFNSVLTSVCGSIGSSSETSKLLLCEEVFENYQLFMLSPNSFKLSC